MSTYGKYTDNELLSLLPQDDEAAFTELYHRFWDRLFGIAWNRIGDKAAAEDIVHDVFAGLWANRKKSGIASAENYLAVAVKYAVLAKIKKLARERAFCRDAGAAPVVDLPVEAAVHYRALMDRVNEAVENLPGKCRLIFKYSRQEGLPVGEIARRLQISPRTVENQLGKAVRRLRLVVNSLLHSLFTFL